MAHVYKTFQELYERPPDTMDDIQLGSYSCFLGSVTISFNDLRDMDKRVSAIASIVHRACTIKDELLRIWRYAIDPHASWIDGAFPSYSYFSPCARKAGLLLLSRIELHNRTYRPLKIGDVVFPSFVDMNSRIVEGFSFGQQMHIGVVLDIQGRRYLVLWRDGSVSSGEENDLIPLNYQFTPKRWKEFWEQFPDRASWSEHKVRPDGVGVYLKNEESQRGVKQKLPKLEELSTPLKKQPLPRSVYSHYYQLHDKQVVLGDRLQICGTELEVNMSCFTDKAGGSGWRNIIAQQLRCRYPDTSPNKHIRMGTTTDLAKALQPFTNVKLTGLYGDLWAVGNMAEATLISKFLLALADRTEIGDVALIGNTRMAFDNLGITYQNYEGFPIFRQTGIYPQGDGRHLYIGTPPTIGKNLVAEKHHWIPVAINAVEYSTMRTISQQHILNLNNKNDNNNGNTNVQTTHPGSGSGEQSGKAHRRPGQKAQAQDGGGYSSDRRSARRSQGKTRSSEISGSENTGKHRRIRISSAEVDPGCEEGGSGVRTGSGISEGGVCGTVRGNPGLVSLDPAGKVDLDGDFDDYCDNCGEERTFKEVRSHTALQSAQYECMACGSYRTFP